MPETEMSPFLRKIERTIVGDQRHFVITLSRANLNHLLADCPEADRLVGSALDGARFEIYPAPFGGLPKKFEFNNSGEVYQAQMGMVGTPPPPNVPCDAYNRMDEIAELNFINAIQRSGDIPIEMHTSLGPINVGFVKIQVEE